MGIQAQLRLWHPQNMKPNALFILLSHFGTFHRESKAFLWIGGCPHVDEQDLGHKCQMPSLTPNYNSNGTETGYLLFRSNPLIF